ncbi:unnamed protein product [Merluccius merluccius]
MLLVSVIVVALLVCFIHEGVTSYRSGGDIAALRPLFGVMERMRGGVRSTEEEGQVHRGNKENGGGDGRGEGRKKEEGGMKNPLLAGEEEEEKDSRAGGPHGPTAPPNSAKEDLFDVTIL